MSYNYSNYNNEYVHTISTFNLLLTLVGYTDVVVTVLLGILKIPLTTVSIDNEKLSSFDNNVSILTYNKPI